MKFYSLIGLLVSASVLISCQQENQHHAVIFKSKVTASEAKKDIAFCKFESEKASGPAPLGAPAMTVGAWRKHHDDIITTCLESKGYDVTRQPGICVENCISHVEVLNTKQK